MAFNANVLRFFQGLFFPFDGFSLGSITNKLLVLESQQISRDEDSEEPSAPIKALTDKPQSTSASGFLGWISNSNLVNKVVERTKVI